MKTRRQRRTGNNYIMEERERERERERSRDGEGKIKSLGSYGKYGHK